MESKAGVKQDLFRQWILKQLDNEKIQGHA